MFVRTVEMGTGRPPGRPNLPLTVQSVEIFVRGRGAFVGGGRRSRHRGRTAVPINRYKVPPLIYLAAHRQRREVILFVCLKTPYI